MKEVENKIKQILEKEHITNYLLSKGRTSVGIFTKLNNEKAIKTTEPSNITLVSIPIKKHTLIITTFELLNHPDKCIMALSIQPTKIHKMLSKEFNKHNPNNYNINAILIKTLSNSTIYLIKFKNNRHKKEVIEKLQTLIEITIQMMKDKLKPEGIVELHQNYKHHII